MSEPVIKPVGRRCPSCREYADHDIPWVHCSFCDADTVALYGPDALVRVAREALNAWVYVGPPPRRPIDDAAEFVVDRLTKGDA